MKRFKSKLNRSIQNIILATTIFGNHNMISKDRKCYFVLGIFVTYIFFTPSFANFRYEFPPLNKFYLKFYWPIFGALELIYFRRFSAGRSENMQHYFNVFWPWLDSILFSSPVLFPLLHIR